ncbi:putative ribonuclease H-like domain-containing protein [Tanacetum coccineum]
MNYNNQQPARFDRRKVRCYKCLQLGHFARECNVKTVDDKARYSAFKVTEVKSDEPKALVSVDSMVNWSDHAAENKTGEVEKVYGMMAGLHADNGGAGISNAADEFAMMGISPKAYQHAVKTLESQKDWYHKTQMALEEKIRVLTANLENTTNTLSYTETLHDQAQKEKKEWEVKYEATLARFEKWKESSKNLNKLINSSMSTRTKVGLGFKEYFGENEVFDLSRPSTMYPEPVEQEVSYGSKSDNKTSETLSESNDFVSCDNSDKSSDSETYASCDSSLKTKTKDFPPAVDIKTLPESDVEDPNSTAGSPSFSCLENVKSPRIFCNKSGMNNRNVCKNNSVRVKKCFVCGSKLHLIKDCDFYNCVDSVPCKSKAASVPAGSRNSSASVTAGGSDPAASRNRPAVNSAGRPNPTGRVGQAAHLAAAQSNPAGWSKRPAPVSAGRPVSAGWLNPAARPYFRPSSVYFNNMYWPELYDPMYMNEGRWGTAGDPSTDNDIGIVDSGCSRSMTGNKEKLDDFVQVKGGIVKFGGGDGRISGKGTIRTSKLDFENVYYVEELQHFNLFSVSQICDKKNKVLFTDTDCLVLTEDFQLPDERQVVLRIPRKCDLYTFSISELQPEQNVTCLVAKASLDESTRWHRRMAHVNFKTINKLAKEGLVDGLPLKVFTNEHNCVACNKGKQHKASYKHISAVRLITETLQLLHMDLFGPTNIRSIDQKYYSLVVTDDFSRFTWTFYLSTKDETFYVLKEFISLIENQLNKKVKGIRCDNGTEFKNAKLIELCGEKGIKRDYSNPRTPQQNGVAERKNRTLIEAARTMLADSKLPTMFWTEAVSTACYVLNRVSITNPHNKTPYELISGKVPQIGHLKPFGCQVTILNTSDHLGKFEGKADEGYLVGYAPNSKAYRAYNLTNKRVEETMNLRFLEDKPNVQGIGHEWYFDLDYLTDSLGYTRFKTDKPAGTQETNINAGTQDHDSDSEVDEQVIVVPSFPSNSFAGPSSSNGPSVMERNADYAEELAKLQRQEYEAKDAAARYGYLFSQETAEILSQAEAEIRNQGVSADRDPAGIDSAGGVSAGSMAKLLLFNERLPGILGATKVFEKKGIDPTDYSIRFKLADHVPKQGVAMAYSASSGSSKKVVPKYVKFMVLEKISECKRTINFIVGEVQNATSHLEHLNGMIEMLEGMHFTLEIYDSVWCLREMVKSENKKLNDLNKQLLDAEEDIRDFVDENMTDDMHVLDEVVFKIHKNGYFELDPLRYVNGSFSSVSAFTCDRDIFPSCLSWILSSIPENIWALFYCLPNTPLEKALKLIHTDNDAISFFAEAECRGKIHLYVTHKQQALGKFYLKNMVWLEEDASLCCSSSSPFRTRIKRKSHKTTKDYGRKNSRGKEKMVDDEPLGRKLLKTSRTGKEKMDELDEFPDLTPN